MKQIYEGPSSGAGAVSRWMGNREVGEGRMPLLESAPDERVRIRREFLKPFQATNDVRFTFQSTGDGTLVSWEMTGRNNFAAKAARLVPNLERNVGGGFAKGLSQLKSIAETATHR